MQSSLSWSRATTNLKSQQKSKPISGNFQQHGHFLISYPKSAISSSFTLRLRSQFQSLELPTYKRNVHALLSERFQLQCSVSSNSYGAADLSRESFRDWIERVGEVISSAFPLWFLLGWLFGMVKPSYFSWVTPRWIDYGLSFTMLGMGMSLTLDDLRRTFAMPKELISGFVIQHTVMLLPGYLLSKLLNLEIPDAAGLILVGCCPGGTASNIVTYIARGNVALSVLMATASNLAVVILTPFLTYKLAGQSVAIDAAAMVMSTLKVLLPVLSGAFINQYFPRLVKFVSPLMPTIAVGTVSILYGNAIAKSGAFVFEGFLASLWVVGVPLLMLGCFLLHASGFFFRYILSRYLGLDVASSRTISIEVGMQNSVPAIILASQHLQNPLTATTSAISVATYLIFGGVLAIIWRRSVPNRK